MFRTAACLAAFAGVLIAGWEPAAARPREDCARSSDAHRRIEACTQLLRETRRRDRRTRAFAYENRSRGHYRIREFERAISDASRAILLNPRSATALRYRADALRRIGNIERALDDYNRALRFDQNSADLYNRRGQAYRKVGDWERAIEDFTQAIRLDPNFARALRNRAHTYREQEKYKEALADYDAALRIDPDLRGVREGRAAVERASGSDRPFDDCMQEADAERRIRGCSVLIADREQSRTVRFFALHNRSYAYVQRGEFEKAVADATQALSIQPNSAFTYGNRADAHRRSERYDEAIADYTKAIELDPGFANAYTSRGQCWRKKGDVEKALTDFSRSLEINPWQPDVHVTRGAIYEERRAYDQALRAYEAALKLHHDHASAIAGAIRVRALADAVAHAPPPPAEEPRQRPEPQRPTEKPDQTAKEEQPEGSGDKSDGSARPEAPSHPPGRLDPVTVAPQSGRLAMVIGIDSYKNIRPLKAAVADAGAVAKTLKEMNFDVAMEKDLDYRAMSRKLVELEQKIKPGDTVFFFFSGHGVALGGVNYLLPADVPAAQAGEESLIKDQAFTVASVVQRIQARGARTAIMVIDACRNDPFEADEGTRSVAGVRGLARIEPPQGVFMLFAAAARQVSYDRLNENDTHPNSVFTRIFIEEIKKAGAKIRDIAKTIQTRVYHLAQSANKEQRPAIYDEIIGELVLQQ